MWLQVNIFAYKHFLRQQQVQPISLRQVVCKSCNDFKGFNSLLTQLYICRKTKFVIFIQECLQAKDYLNYRYHFKRACYLSWLASALKKWEHNAGLMFSSDEDVYKPIIKIKLKGRCFKCRNFCRKIFCIQILPKVMLRNIPVSIHKSLCMRKKAFLQFKRVERKLQPRAVYFIFNFMHNFDNKMNNTTNGH